MVDIWENHLDSELCRDIIRRFENNTTCQYQGVVNNGEGITSVNPSTKKCTELQISMHEHWKDIDEILFERFSDAVEKAREKHPGLASISGELQDEGYRIKRYLPDGTEMFKFHIDVNGYPQAHRQLVFMWYLNTVKEGGETVFHEQNIAVQPIEGRLVAFPPFWTHSHTANAPISEPKYVITGWLTFPKVQSAPALRKVIDYDTRR